MQITIFVMIARRSKIGSLELNVFKNLSASVLLFNKNGPCTILTGNNLITNRVYTNTLL